MEDFLSKPVKFMWDKGNSKKNEAKHNVSDSECEEVFFDPDKKILKDVLHSGDETRYVLLGKTRADRVLFIVFTLRKKRIRVISARDLNKRERHLYD